MNANSLWVSVLDSLRGRLSARRLEEIRAASHTLERSQSSLRVAARSEALREWVPDRRLAMLDAAVTELSDGGLELAMLPLPASEPAQARPRDPTTELTRFIASPANQAAFECARALARGANPVPGPIVFRGPPGSGKTHLLRGIAAAQSDAGLDVLCHHAESLSLDLVASLRQNQLARFRERLRRCGTLLIDDTHALIGREATQDELAAAIAARVGQRAPVALSSRLSASEAHEMREPLRSCLHDGRVFELPAPEWETRVAVILNRIALWQVEIAPEVGSLLARTLGASLTRLDVMITRLMTHPACAGGLVDPELVQGILENGGPALIVARPQDVLRLVSRHFSVRPAELRSETRGRLTVPRQLAMYLMRHHCRLSYPEIGRRLRRHHTTAMHACRRIEQQRERSSSVRTAVLVLEKELLRLSQDGG